MSKSSREAKMREVRKFDAFRVYYAGEEVAGLPLTGISGEESQRNGPWRSPGPSFSYGNCRLPSGLFAEGGCSVPLQIQNWSRCSSWPGQYPHGHRLRVFDFRGARPPGPGGWKSSPAARRSSSSAPPATQRPPFANCATSTRPIRQNFSPARLPAHCGVTGPASASDG
jgi:hypothetical protein